MRSEFHTAVCALCAKASIPEVEAVIRLLDPWIRQRLRDIASDVYEQLLARLSALSDAEVDALVQPGRSREDVLAAILAALLLLVDRNYGAFVSVEARQRTEDAVDALFAFASREAGTALPEAQAVLLKQAAVDQLGTMLQDTVLGRRGELEALLREQLSPAASGGFLAPVVAATPPEAFQVELAKILAPEQAASASVDAWAYLWANAGGVAAATAAGFRAFEVVATGGKEGDGRTTRFCRWAHGRIIPLSRMQAQINALTSASLRGDAATLRSAWPFLDAETARNGNELQFELFFRSAGLPPYHFGCRSRAKPVRISR